MTESAALSSRTPDELAQLAFERIRIEPVGVVVTAWVGELDVARSERVLALHETGHVVRYYFPREDVDLSSLVPLDRVTHCPFKGDASEYWTLRAQGAGAEPVAWSYPDPIEASRPIAGHVAFSDSVVVEVAPR